MGNADLTLNFTHDTDARDLRRDLPEQLQPLGAQAKFELGEAGGVGPRPRHALDEAGADRIDSLSHHDRHCVANLLQDECGRADPGHDHIRAKCDQIGRFFAQAGSIATAPAGVHPQVTADGPARLLQSLDQRRNSRLRVWLVRRGVHQHADAPHPLGLLRARRAAIQPPRRRAVI